MVLANDTRFGSQIVIPTFKSEMYFRRYFNGTRDPSWITVWSSNNLNKADVDLNYKNLRANGNLWAKEIKVAISNPWPDYVFGNNYRLTPLSVVEKSIKKMGYLSNMPSAAQVAKKGIDIAAMNAKLLEKIEELTLHMISFDKEHSKLKAQLKATQREIEILKSENKNRRIATSKTE